MKPNHTNPPTQLRLDLFGVADKHHKDGRLLGETLLLAATTCLAAGMNPEQGVEAFTEVMVDVFRCISHDGLSPLAQVVRTEA
tara:strand:- start:4187 stop:4435 length:249 start_codon:yes stop_codon:yes gene_type:complete